mmetsp:Transcript_9779/g.30999  ORF Transcript_9779/g.30999 Transcript_9779/m.30999 type:complete len:625 (-) Transcript_9779:34-1908(-)
MSLFLLLLFLLGSATCTIFLPDFSLKTRAELTVESSEEVTVTLTGQSSLQPLPQYLYTSLSHIHIITQHYLKIGSFSKDFFSATKFHLVEGKGGGPDGSGNGVCGSSSSSSTFVLPFTLPDRDSTPLTIYLCGTGSLAYLPHELGHHLFFELSGVEDHVGGLVMEAYALLEHFADVLHFGVNLGFGYGKEGGSSLPPDFGPNGTVSVDSASDGDALLPPVGAFDGSLCGEALACTTAGMYTRRSPSQCSAAAAADDPAVFGGDADACDELAADRTGFTCDQPLGTTSLRWTVASLRDAWRPSCTNVLHTGPSSTEDEAFSCPTSAETCTIPYHRNSALYSAVFARTVDGAGGAPAIGLSRALAIWGRGSASFGTALNNDDVNLFADFAKALVGACESLAEDETVVYALPLDGDEGGLINSTHCEALKTQLAAAGVLDDEVLLPCGEYRCAASGGALGASTELIIITIAATCGVLALGAASFGGLAFFYYRNVWLPDQEEAAELALMADSIAASEREAEAREKAEVAGSPAASEGRPSRRVSRTGSRSHVRTGGASKGGSKRASRAVPRAEVAAALGHVAEADVVLEEAAATPADEAMVVVPQAAVVPDNEGTPVKVEEEEVEGA